MTNKKGTKRALLTSVLSLLLCCSMLIGTTFAWFTDTVESGINRIQAGNLDVEVYYGKDAEPKTNKVAGATNIFTDVDGNEVLWEPGAVAYTNLNVVNEGSLALKYQFAMNFINENWIEGTNAKLSQVLKVAFLDSPVSGTREQILEAASGNGVLLSALTKSGFLTKETNKVYGVVIYWEPSVMDNNWNVFDGKTTNDGQPLHIDLGLKLIATQMMYEEDSFGNNYDEKASVVVEPGESIANAIKDVEDGGIVFLENGVHDLSSGPIVIEGKNVTIVGLGKVTINKNYGNTHIFTVKNGAEVTIENVTMDGKGNTREGIYVRWNSKVTLKDVVIKNTGGSDIMVDEASDAAHGQTTASYVTLYNSHVEDVALCASPVTTVAAEQNTFVYFDYKDGSTVGAIDVQNINKKPENIIINGVKSTEVGKTMQLFVANDAELAAALETIKTDSNYWNKNVIVYLAAGEYSADHVINQYPQWNGVVGAGATANNYAAGVPAGAPSTVITFVGETASTYSLRAAATPAVVFTGNVTVNGFGNAGTAFGSAVATTTFQNIAFDAANSADNAEDYITMYVKAAANNVTFDGCTFLNATHVTLGGSGANGVGTVNVIGCTFDNGGCLSGYVETLNVKDTTFTSTTTGFIDKKKAGPVTVENCVVDCAVYFLRTDNSGITVNVKDCEIKETDVENSKGTGLVVFRGSGHTATFIDCELAYDTLKSGAGTGTLEITNFVEEAGITYAKDGIDGSTTLYKVPAEYEETTVNVADGTTAIGGYAFADNQNIETIVLPSSVTTLNDRAFRNTSASTIVLNEGLTNISYQAFRDALNVTAVEIPSTVTTISTAAFQNSGITELVIPANVTTIEYGGLRDMKMLENVTIEGNVEIPVYAFRACTNLKTVVLKGNDVTFGGRGMIFTNKENGDGSAITVTVANELIKARLLEADTAAKDYGGYTIICEQTTQPGGYYTDTEGNAYVYDHDGLSAALEAGANNIVLPVDVANNNETVSNSYGKTGYSQTNGGVLDGNGNTMTVTGANGTWDSGINTTGGTIKNITVTGAFRGIFINHNSSNCGKVILENVILDGVTYTISCDQGTNNGLQATGCTFNGWTSYAATIGDVEFIDCNFGEGNGYNFSRPYAPTAYVGCNFAAGHKIDARAAVTFENCTIGGEPLTAENLSTLVTSNIANVTVK